jgi:hypothetical protein
MRELAGDRGEARIAEAIGKRERPGGVWVQAAAYLVTAAPGPV